MKKSLLFGAALFMAAGAMAQSIEPLDIEPVYFNSFEDEDLNGARIVGGGEIMDIGGVYGNVFSNAMNGMRQNYLLLPEDALTHSAETEEITILFWVNRGNETDSEHYQWSPIFSAYESAESNIWPMLVCQYRGILQINNAGWCDYEDIYNVKGVNTAYFAANDSDWLADGEWHLYAVTFTPKTAKVFFDGEIANEWKIPNEDDRTAEGLFTNGVAYKHICLGGNQAWDWADPDPGFWFDDLAIYDEVLGKDELKTIMALKNAEDNAVDMSVANGVAVEYYDMNGMRVANPSNGIYIKRQGKNISKVIVK